MPVCAWNHLKLRANTLKILYIGLFTQSHLLLQGYCRNFDSPALVCYRGRAKGMLLLPVADNARGEHDAYSPAAID